MDTQVIPENPPVSVDQLVTAIPGEWKFDAQVAEHFDGHVRKSVPFYDQVQEMVVEMSEWFVRDRSVVYDLGSSTGETIAQLVQKHGSKKDLRLFGVENSLPMIEKAREKCPYENVQFLHQDIGEITEFRDVDLVVSLYTLQFVDLSRRRALLETIYRDLNAGGALILVEKIRGETSLFEDIWVELYWDMKQRSGLNCTQVINKARSLRGVLMPLTISENISLLEDAGFRNVDVFMKWYNFAGLVAVKL